ncbi:unnamed protein product [Ophioblennius macclurei]
MSDGPSLQDPSGPARAQGGTGSLAEEAFAILSSTSSRLARTLLGREATALRRHDGEATPLSSCDEDSGGGGGSGGSNAARRKREFTPNEKKDEGYWDKRRKNNEAAKRSREKRRANDMVLERRVLDLLEENARLRAELLALKFRFGLVKDAADVSILPLAAPVCPHAAATPCYQPHGGDGPQRVGANHQVHPQAPPPPPPPPHGVIYGSQTEECSVSASSSSPVFFDDSPGEYGRPTAAREAGSEHADAGEGSQADGLRSLPHKLRFKGPVGGGGGGGEMCSSPERRPGGPPVAMVGPNVQTPAPWEAHGAWPSGEAYSASSGYYNAAAPAAAAPQNARDNKCWSAADASLRSQVSCLSQEVAQLKRLFSQQLLANVS